MARKILNYETFANSQEFVEWQLKNPLCDVMRISPVPVTGIFPHSIGGVFVVWREYAE